MIVAVNAYAPASVNRTAPRLRALPRLTLRANSMQPKSMIYYRKYSLSIVY